MPRASDGWRDPRRPACDRRRSDRREHGSAHRRARRRRRRCRAGAPAGVRSRRRRRRALANERASSRSGGDGDGTGPAAIAAVWAEITGRAAEHARTALLYVLFMAAAGVVAGVGVLNGSSILVVGAMALSPDLLPISAAAVGLVERRWALAARAALTLCIGLGDRRADGGGCHALLRLFGRIDRGLELADTALGPSLTEIGPGTVLVALGRWHGRDAGVRDGRRRGGRCRHLGDDDPRRCLRRVRASVSGVEQRGVGALDVLATNVVCIVAGSTLTLFVQRRWRARPSGRLDSRLAGDPYEPRHRHRRHRRRRRRSPITAMLIVRRTAPDGSYFARRRSRRRRVRCVGDRVCRAARLGRLPRLRQLRRSTRRRRGRGADRRAAGRDRAVLPAVGRRAS